MFDSDVQRGGGGFTVCADFGLGESGVFVGKPYNYVHVFRRVHSVHTVCEITHVACERT